MKAKENRSRDQARRMLQAANSLPEPQRSFLEGYMTGIAHAKREEVQK